MRTQHTPGPWIKQGEAVWNADEVMYVAATIFGIINPSQTLEANARLIAAAPTMLEALQYLSNLHPRDCILAEVIRARDAITAATGESNGH